MFALAGLEEAAWFPPLPPISVLPKLLEAEGEAEAAAEADETAAPVTDGNKWYVSCIGTLFSEIVKKKCDIIMLWSWNKETWRI